MTTNDNNIIQALARTVEAVIYDCVEYGEYNIESNIFSVYTSYADDEHRYKRVVITTTNRDIFACVSWVACGIERTLSISCPSAEIFHAIDHVLTDYHGLTAEWL